MTQEEHLEYNHHSSSNSVHDQVNDDTTKSKNITTATSNQTVVDPTTTSSRDAQTDKLSPSDSNRRLNNKQQFVDNENKNVSVDNNTKDKATSECFNKTVNNKPSDNNENNNNNNNKRIENITKTFDSDIVTDSNKDCSKTSESNRTKYFNRSRQGTFDRSVSLDFEDPIERLNKLKSNITDVLKEVKAVLDKHSEPEPEKEEDIKPLDENVIRFRFIRRIRKRTSFDLEEEQARKNILKEEENITSKNIDQNKMGIQNSFVITNEEHNNLIDKKLDIESHKSDISEFNENKLETETWPHENQHNKSTNSELSHEGYNVNDNTTQKTDILAAESKSNDEFQRNQLEFNLETLNKQIEPQEIPSTKITTSINQITNNESTQGSSIKSDNDELLKTKESVVVVNKTESNETPSVNDKSIEEKPKKKLVKKAISSSRKEKIDSNKSTETKIASSTNKTNSEKSETEASKLKLNKTISLETSTIPNVENKVEVKESSQNKVTTSSTTESKAIKTSTKKPTSEPPKENIVSENKNEINKISSPPKTIKTSSIEEVEKSNKTEPAKKTDENLKEVKKEEKIIANQITTETKTEMPPQSTDGLTKKEAPTEDVDKKKIVKKVIKPTTDSGNDMKTAVKTTKEVQKEPTIKSEEQVPNTTVSNESASTKEEPTEDKTKKKVLKKIIKTTAKVLPVEISTASENNKKVEEHQESKTNSISSTIQTPLNEEISTDKTKKKTIKKSSNDNEKKVTKTVKSDQIKPTEQKQTVDSPVKSTESNATTPTASMQTATSANKNNSSSVKNSNLIETNHATNEIKTENKLPTAKDNNKQVAPTKTASLIPIPDKTIAPEPPKDVIPLSKNEVVPDPAKEVISVLPKDVTTEPVREVTSVPELKISTTPANQESTKSEIKETKDEQLVKVKNEAKLGPTTAPTFTITAPKGELKEEKNLKITTEPKPEEKISIRRRPSAPEQLEGNKIVEKVILRRRPSSLLPNSLSTEQKSDTTSEGKTLVRRRPSSLVLNSAEQKDETAKPTRRRPSSLLSNTTTLEQNAIQVEPATKESKPKPKEEVIESKPTTALPSSDNSSSSIPQLEPKTSPLQSPLSPTSKSMGSSALDKVLAITNLKPITDKKIVSTIIVKPPISMMLQSQKSLEKLTYAPTINKTIMPVPENCQQPKISTTSTPVAESIIPMKQISEKSLTDIHKKAPSASINALTTSIPQEVDLKSISNKIVATTAEPVISSSPQKTTAQKIQPPSSPTTLDIPGNKTIKNKKVEQPPTKSDEISSVPQSPVKDELKIKQDDKTKEDVVVVVTSKKSSISLNNSIGKTQENNKQTNQHAHIPNEKESNNKKESATKTDKTKTNDVSSYQQKSATESNNNKTPTKIASEKTSKPTLKTPLKIETNSITTVAIKPKLTLLPAPSKAVQLVPVKLDVIPVQKPALVKTVEIKKPTPQIPVLEHKPQEESAETEKTATEKLVEHPSDALVAGETAATVELGKEEVTESSATPSTELVAPTIKTVEAEPPLAALPEISSSSSASIEPSVTPSEISDISLEEPPTAPSESIEAATEALETEGQDNDAPTPPKKPKKKKSKKKMIKVVIKRIKRKLSKDDTPIVEVEPEICEKEIEPKPAEPDSDEGEEEPEPSGPTKPKSCLKPREYEPGDIVMYADCIRKMVKWKKATVLERITSISYKLDVNGEEKSAHICYIKKYTEKKVQFGGKEYLEIDYAQLEAEEEEPEYNIWARV